MKTSIIGYPRIGKLRELKFASEKYFRNEIAQSELFDTAKKLRDVYKRQNYNNAGNRTCNQTCSYRN